MTAPDQPGNRAAMQATWDAAAAGWDENGALIRQWLRTPTAALLDAAAIGHGDHVLDIAAGAGDQTIDVSRRVGPSGSVVAIDLSPELVARARINLERAGCSNADVRTGDGEALHVGEGFDAAICRLGLMFYADPFAGLAEMRRVLKPGGRAAVLVFSGPEDNPLIVEQLAIAAHHARVPPNDPRRPGGLLSLGDPAALTALFDRAGFGVINCELVPAPLHLPTTKAYVDFLRGAAGPIVRLANQMAPDVQTSFWARLHSAFARFEREDGWCGPHTLLLASGRA